MKKSFYYILVAMIAVPLSLFAGTQGKVKGKVVDSQTGEALVGASVAIIGTAFGSTTDINGEFTIGRVEVGTYTLKASYIGYQSVTISNTKVLADLTSETNFKLPAVGVVGQEVVIIAQRPLINKSSTNAVRIVDAEAISNLPARGIDVVIRTQPGVVQRNNGDTYIRGSRPDQTAYTIEGVSISNQLSGARAISITDAALEQVQVQSGGYPAEFPGANGGIVSASLKTGGADFHATMQGETDNYTGQNKKSLGGYSYGYSDYTVSLSGAVPEIDQLRFFAAVQNTFWRDRNLSFHDGLDYTGVNALVAASARSAAHPTSALQDTLNFAWPAGNLSNGSDNTYQYSGTLLYNAGDVQVKASGSFANRNNRAQPTYRTFFDQMRLPVYNTKDGFAQLKFSHFITPKVSYEISGNYSFRNATTRDPLLGDNFEAYGDTAANWAVGYNPYYYSSGVKQNVEFPDWNILDGTVTFIQPGVLPDAVYVMYRDEHQYKIGGKIDFSAQLDAHTIKLGAEYSQGLVRAFQPELSTRFYTLHDTTLTLAQKESQIRQTGAGNYGYDIYGREIDGDVVLNGSILDFGPPKPTTAGIYLQDKIELSDINLNLGVRYDYISTDSRDFLNPNWIVRDTATSMISDASLKKTDPVSQVSPRVGFSFPVSDRTKFHAQYGQFISPTKGSDSYRSLSTISSQIFTGGFFYSNPVGFGLKPERSTLYEIGFEQQLGENASLDITTYYKDIQDQVTFAQISPEGAAEHGVYQSLVNQDFATTKGVEFKFTLRRVERIEAQVNYTFSDARATGTGPLSIAGTVGGSADPTFIPKFVFPTENNQAHRGTISFDYRFAKDDGGLILERMGLNILFEFNSGFSFTRLKIDGPTTGDGRARIPLEQLGASTTPWFFRLDAKLDKLVGLGLLDAVFYVRVTNLLNRQNAIAVFPRTGDPRDDGWLSTVDGSKKATSLGPQYVTLYNGLNGGLNSGQFDSPRQIVFGMKLLY